MDACSRKPVETAAEAAKVVAWAVVGARENSLHGIASELAFVGAYLTRPAADPGEDGELAKLMERMGLARDMLSGHLMPDAANAVSAGIDRLETQAADSARLREALERIKQIAQRKDMGAPAKVACIESIAHSAALSPNPTTSRSR